jgi:hypothetical protein
MVPIGIQRSCWHGADQAWLLPAEGRTTVAVTEHGREADHVPGRRVGGRCTPSVVSSHMGLADYEECGRGGMTVVDATIQGVVV